MGASLTIPSPTARPQVIVAGLPRTGTASLCAALAIILDGPVYHGGTQMSHGPSSEVLSWIRLLKLFPFTHATRPTVLSIIQDRCEGYVAVADGPVRQLVPELMELYPDAVVVCSTRDAVEWERSFGKVAGTATQWFLKFVLLPLSPTRYFVEYVKLVMRQWDYLYGESNPQTTRTYLRHVEWMSEAVPKDKLVFFDVKEGWGPLCERWGRRCPTSSSRRSMMLKPSRVWQRGS